MSARIPIPETVKPAALMLLGRGEAIPTDAVMREIGGGAKVAVTPMLPNLQSTMVQLRSETTDAPAPAKSATSRAMLAIWGAAEDRSRLLIEQNLALEGQKAAMQMRLDQMERAGGRDQQTMHDLMTRPHTQRNRFVTPALDAAAAA